jgi:rfaE bifunctional protein nucleotidyltransferase chain/domain
MSRKHNNSNILCLGSWSLTNDQEVFSILNNWINSTWQKGRHINRVNKLDLVEGLVFTNGVFDLFHQGHFELLKFAKNCGKKLIVGIDSDKRVREIKGKFRPIIDQFSRKKILECLNIVDQVIIFNSKSELINLYKTLKPQTIVRGNENKNIRKIDQIPPEIKIILFNKRKNISTTKIISKLQRVKI